MYYLNARYYDSVTARFITEDTYRGTTIDPLSLNLYTYCSNNPLIYYDPTGHSWKDILNGAKEKVTSAFKTVKNAVSGAAKTVSNAVSKQLKKTCESGKKTIKSGMNYAKDHKVQIAIAVAVVSIVAGILTAGVSAEVEAEVGAGVGLTAAASTVSAKTMLGAGLTFSGLSLGTEAMVDCVENKEADAQKYAGTYTGALVTGMCFPQVGAASFAKLGQAAVAGMAGSITEQSISTGKIDSKQVINEGVTTGAFYTVGAIASRYIPQAVNMLTKSSKEVDVLSECGKGTINPNEIRYSQSSVNGSSDIIESMKKNGWKGDPIDVVEMPDGIYTTIDNTRVVSAREAGINVQANVHGYNDVLPAEYVERFTTKKGVPNTWGEAISLRVGKQKASFRNGNLFGAFDMDTIK